LKTRTDQALKMLRACFKASNGFKDPLSDSFNPKVGIPGLGLWSGERLLEIYQSGWIGEDERDGVIKEQIELNQDHLISLKSIPHL
ncbi:hypothetical protein DFH28DRAFT_891525, partial [Melampsora americana]